MGSRPSSRSVGDQAEQVDAETLLAQDHAVQYRRRCATPSARRASPSNVDVLGDLHRNHRQLDDFPSALDPAAGQVGAAIGTVLHHVLHPMGRCHATAGKAVASLLAGPRLRWGLPARFRLEAGHSGWATRFGLAFQFGNPPLQPLNHPLLFQNGGLQLGDDGDEDSAVGGGEINFSIHDPVYDITTATRASLRQPAFGQFTSSSLNCYALLHYLYVAVVPWTGRSAGRARGARRSLLGEPGHNPGLHRRQVGRPSRRSGRSERIQGL